jgi:hypothetical protein
LLLSLDNAKILQVLFIGETSLQHFDGSQGLIVDMLTQVDITKAASAQPAIEAMFPKALAHAIYAISHLQTLFCDTLEWMSILPVHPELSAVDESIVE